jgi:ribosomal protein S18 acetylase RimI-like enzyme
MNTMVAASSQKEGAVQVRSAVGSDLEGIARLGGEAFSGLRPPERADAWVRACWSAQPRFLYYVAEEKGSLLGYILWMEKGGFRTEAVLELEQITVDPHQRHRGIGAQLIQSSLADIRERLRSRGARLKLVEVTTGSEQGAVDFYRRTLGAEVAAQIPDVFRGEEYILIARE